LDGGKDAGGVDGPQMPEATVSDTTAAPIICDTVSCAGRVANEVGPTSAVDDKIGVDRNIVMSEKRARKPSTRLVDIDDVSGSRAKRPAVATSSRASSSQRMKAAASVDVDGGRCGAAPSEQPQSPPALQKPRLGALARPHIAVRSVVVPSTDITHPASSSRCAFHARRATTPTIRRLSQSSTMLAVRGTRLFWTLCAFESILKSELVHGDVPCCTSI
jgi:hypothetical protein